MLISCWKLDAQCDDSQAKNYGENEDCRYKSKKGKLKKKVKLPKVLNETSALLWSNEALWTLNDGGNANRLYKVDVQTGEILQEVVIEGERNQDWEALAADDEHIYIGDFGNNRSNRKKLQILKIKKAAITIDSICSVAAEKIRFSYPEQKRFDIKKNNYDCEGFFYHQNQLHLFTKNRGNLKTNHYTLPTKAGTHKAILQDSLNIEALATGADIQEGVVTLLAYTKKKVYLWVFYDFEGIHFFKGKKLKLKLGATWKHGQAEGVVLKNRYEGFVASEKTSITKAKFKRFSLKKWLGAFFESSTK